MLRVSCIPVANGTVILSTTLTQCVLPGDEIIFDCRVFGEVMSWSSAEYIGGGGATIEFSQDIPEGTEKSRNSTVATFVNVTVVGDGMVVIESELRIVVSASYPSATITCRNGHNNVVRSITLNLSSSTYTHT